ncbi:MAG: response regulator [Acidobacteria bacterium]|nr:response regulator [Acidobacteriota bacterium]
MLIPRSQPRILLIEESVAIAAPIKALLEQNDFRVDLASDCTEVMETVDQSYAIIIVDLKLSSDSGFTFVQWLHTTRGHLLARVIVISGDEHGSVAKRLAEIGICDLLPKPVDAEEILRTIWECLEKAPTYSLH